MAEWRYILSHMNKTTYLYVTFEAFYAGGITTERVTVPLNNDPVEEVLSALDELHATTGIPPQDMSVAMPRELFGAFTVSPRAQSMLRTTAGLSLPITNNRIAELLGVKMVTAADIFAAFAECWICNRPIRNKHDATDTNRDTPTRAEAWAHKDCAAEARAELKYGGEE